MVNEDIESKFFPYSSYTNKDIKKLIRRNAIDELAKFMNSDALSRKEKIFIGFNKKGGINRKRLSKIASSIFLQTSPVFYKRLDLPSSNLPLIYAGPEKKGNKGLKFSQFDKSQNAFILKPTLSTKSTKKYATSFKKLFIYYLSKNFLKKDMKLNGALELGYILYSLHLSALEFSNSYYFKKSSFKNLLKAKLQDKTFSSIKVTELIIYQLYELLNCYNSAYYNLGKSNIALVPTETNQLLCKLINWRFSFELEVSHLQNPIEPPVHFYSAEPCENSLPISDVLIKFDKLLFGDKCRE